MAGRTRIASVMRLVAARLSAQREAGQSVPAAYAINSLYRQVVRSAFRDPVELGVFGDGDDPSPSVSPKDRMAGAPRLLARARGTRGETLWMRNGRWR